MKFESHDPNLIQKLSEFFQRAPEECVALSVYADGVKCNRVVSFDTVTCVVEVYSHTDFTQGEEPKIIANTVRAYTLVVVGQRGWTEQFKPVSGNN